jgi:hypothetical protein
VIFTIFGHVMKKPFDEKIGPNNHASLTSCGWGVHGGPLAHNHIHTYKT